MTIGQFLIMRHEVLLALLLIVVLLLEIFVSDKNKNRITDITIWGFFLVTLAGFLPINRGTLFGGSYQLTGLTLVMKNILNIGVFIVLLQSAGWLKKDENRDKISEYFLLMLSSVIGMSYMISAGDLLIFYLGLELATIPVAILAAFDKSKNRSAEAGIKLILSSAFSSGILLYGLSMIYGTTGSIYFNEIGEHFTGNALQVLGFIFYVAGMGFKISLVPFHFWTADVYEGAPVNVTSFLSVVSKGAAVFILAIMLTRLFGNNTKIHDEIFYTLAVATMTLANLFALRQQNLKRLLAFSSIAQAGFIMLGILGGDGLGIASIVYFVLIYVFTNLAAFGVVAIISNATGRETINEYNGLYKTNPLLSLTMMLALFSLAGIPPVSGFFGKFFLFTSAASREFLILVLIAVLNATISLYYYLLVIRAMFIEKSETPVAAIRTDNYGRIGLLICVTGIFVVGFASIIYEYIASVSMI